MKKAGKTGLDSAAREQYWNEDYVRYWKARVAEANEGESGKSELVSGDARTGPDKLYLAAIALLEIGADDNVLELACGFGRSLPTLSGIARHVTAVDISAEMIKYAREACDARNVSFEVSPSEELPFPDESFDAVVCFAAFDAMYQAETLAEINRVCRTGARVLITGKNDNYHDDDGAALEAEAGARAKNHPNYFTDVNKLLANAGKFGFRSKIERYYARRGDFAKETPSASRPEKFYEFLLVLTKTGPSTVGEDFPISSAISKTYARRQRPA